MVRSHFGARRFAFNWGLALVKADLDARKLDPGHESVGWDLGSLRKVWNRAKNEVAPWWATNSKECYSAGLADLAQACVTGTTARTAAGLVGGWGSRGSNQLAATPIGCGFTTGAMRLEDDRRTITVPVIGGLRSKENTRRVQRHLASGRAQILNMTLVAAVGPVVRVGRLRTAHPERSAELPPNLPCAPVLTSGCAPWPPSPRSTPPPAPKPLSSMRIRPRSEPPWRRGGGPGVNFPAASPAHAVIGQRKPS